VHDRRALAERRITRELAERVVPLVHHETVTLDIEAGPRPDELTPFRVGDRWGPPWGTTWFRFTGTVPDRWLPLRTHRRVEAVIDLGFHPDAAGFQCEGLVVDAHHRPVQGIHPRRTGFVLPAEAGPFEILVEAASNPTFVQFRPSALGDPGTLGDHPAELYRFRRADLALVDTGAESLAHDLDVLDGLMRTLAVDDPRRARLLHLIERALDAVPDVAAARHLLRPALDLPARAGAHRVIASGHAHIDTAWLWPISETMRKCTRTFASAVRLMDEWPDYRFACSQAQQYAWIEQQHPDLFDRITEKVAAQQWIPVGGSWVEADMNLPSGESLVRQIVFGQRYFEDRFGMRCTEMWIPDVFGYPATLPQVFAAGGMRRFVTQKLSWNKQNRFPHHTFWWEGLDGTRVLTHFPPVDTYNAEITPTECAHASSNFAEHAWSDWSLMPFGHGDGGGGPTREMLERRARMTDLDGAPRIEIGTPAQFFERVEHEILLGADAPTWRGELYFETHRGTLTSQWRTKAGNQRCERLLREVELWAAAAGQPAGVDHLWRDVLTQQFHDIIPGSSIAWVHDDAEAVHHRVAAELEGRISELLDALVPGPPTLASAASHPRDEVVIVPTGDGESFGEDDPPGEGPTQALGPAGTAFRARVPACGTAPAEALPVHDRVVVSERSMTNHHLAVRWDDAGNLTSIINLTHSRELIPDGEIGATLELAADHPVEYDAWDVESWTVEAGRPITHADSIEVVANGPLVGRVRVERSAGPSTFVVTYTMRAGSPRLDIEVEADWQHREHLLSMSFPLDVRAATASCDVQFGVVQRPTHPSTSWDAAKFEVCAHRFVDLSEPSFGVAVINDGPYGHGLFGGRIRVSLLRAASYPDPDADRGRFTTRLAVFPHGAGLAEVTAEAERFTRPVRLVTGTADHASLPVVELHGGDGVEIDAVKPADDGSGDLVVRLHEHLGDRRHVTVSCPGRRITSASTCNLMEEAEAGLEVGDGIAAITLAPFRLITLRLGF
jgi:alpha-mannosidase